MLIGTDGVYSYTFQHEQREDCPVCGDTSLEISISRDWTVENLIEMLEEKQGMYVIHVSGLGFYSLFMPLLFADSQIKKPSLSSGTTQIYFQAPPQLEEATRPNLQKKVSELVEDGSDILVTASSLPLNLNLLVTFV
jgi:NEDD8-activating enzyme E1